MAHVVAVRRVGQIWDASIGSSYRNRTQSPLLRVYDGCAIARNSEPFLRLCRVLRASALTALHKPVASWFCAWFLWRVWHLVLASGFWGVWQGEILNGTHFVTCTLVTRVLPHLEIFGMLLTVAHL